MRPVLRRDMLRLLAAGGAAALMSPAAMQGQARGQILTRRIQRYATINWAARYFAALFAIQGLLLVWQGAVRGRLRFDLSWQPAASAAVGLLVVALVFEPIAGLVAGRTWRQLEIFGVTPDPTAIATLAFLAPTTPRAHRALLVIPVAWCLIGGATLWALGSAEAWVVLLAGLSGSVLAISRANA